MAKLNRRNVLLGLGTAAAGSGIVFGSGAFTQVEADRSVNIEVDNDPDGLLAIDDGDEIETVEIDDGELNFDSDNIADDTEGFNNNAEVKIGETDGSFGSGDVTNDENEAFNVESNFDSDEEPIQVEIDASGIDDDQGTLTFVVTLANDDDDGFDTARISNDDTANDGESVEVAIDTGETVRSSLEIETDGDEDGAFGGDLKFTVLPETDSPDLEDPDPA